VAEVLLHHPRWPALDTFQGALGGPFILAFLAMPFYLLLGVTPLASKLAAYVTATGLVLVVYVLLDRHESRRAALVAAASFSFTPPALFFASAVLGNLHWTQLIFDYGLALFGLELVLRGGKTRTWSVFGLVCGLAVFHSVGSLPFLAITAGGALLLARPGVRRALSFGIAFLIGAAPFAYKLLVHDAFGIGVGSGEQTVGRLAPAGFDFAGLTALVYPEAPLGLLFHRTMETWPMQPGWTLALLWTGVVWLGLVALLITFGGADSGEQAGRRPTLVAAIPLLFVAVFGGAYVVIPGAALNLSLPEFTNVREEGFRNLPMLWAALIVASAIGLTRLAARLGRLRGRCLTALAFLPAVCGLLGGLSVIEADGPEQQRSLQSFRAVCFDAFGVFAASSLGGTPWRVTEVCDLLEGEAAQRECLSGAAWGVGMGETGLPSATYDPPTLPPGAPTFVISDRPVAACDRLSEELSDGCYFGVGWTVGAYRWGHEDWPATACDSLKARGPRDACWTGVGFRVGDHLHPQPEAMAAVIARVPKVRRDQVAEGAGVGLGRGLGNEVWAASFCQRMGGAHVGACVRGVRRSFAMRGGER
jgi:hypothetical protein